MSVQFSSVKFSYFLQHKNMKTIQTLRQLKTLQVLALTIQKAIKGSRVKEKIKAGIRAKH